MRQYGAAIDIQDFLRLHGARRGEGSKIPKGMDAAFTTPASELERQINGLIDEYNEDELSKQAH